MKNRKKVFETNNICAVPVDNDMSHIFTINEALQNSEIVSMPCDRSLGSDKALSCRFLNGEAYFPHGAFVLAAIFDVPVLTIFVIKESISNYHVYVKPLITKGSEQLDKREKANSLNRSFVNELENIEKQYPEQWFNFYEFWK